MPLEPYIEELQDVGADGNCGFRAVATSLGLHQGESGEIRKKLKREINRKRKIYEKLAQQTFFESLDDMLSRLTCRTSPAPWEKWMQMPFLGDLIENSYSRPVFFYSYSQNLTFLTFFCPPNDNPPICFCFWHNSAHFVSLRMKPGVFPVGKLVTHWKKHNTSEAKVWQTKISKYLNLGKEKLSPPPRNLLKNLL